MKCMMELKADNYTWTALVDTDEFILKNHYAFDDYNVFQNLANVSNSTTVLEILQGSKTTNNDAFKSLLRRPCLPMTKLQFGTKESTQDQVNQQVPQGFNGSHFLTLRWRWHHGIKNPQQNRRGKAMIDVSRVPDRDFFVENVYQHRPIRTLCYENGMFQGNRKSPFTTHHYVGTWEQWSFRDDPRSWTRRNRDKYNQTSVVKSTDDYARSWLTDFVQKHGIKTAAALLEGVGEVAGNFQSRHF
jgi:hypothetical protein